MTNPFEFIQDIEYLQESYDFLDDKDFGECMNRAIRILSRNDVPQGPKLAKLIVDMGAYSLQFRIAYAYYMGRGKGTQDAAQKKNIYREAYEGVDRLCDALKYLAKAT